MNLQIIETKETKEAKASVDTVDFALIEYTAEDHSKDIDAYLDTAVQADKFGCGSRYDPFIYCSIYGRLQGDI